ncbi:hypothetical protein EMIHUDRAFT_354820, partial [Emiliania huxleyi CCMP1516]|uniref:Uncharacterized protein n=2 Tax=Emiliania huxleyi TaxID=2903 RepID=A0A0D3JDU3_EMIH1
MREWRAAVTEARREAAAAAAAAAGLGERRREEEQRRREEEQRRRSLAVDGSAFEPGSPCHCDRRKRSSRPTSSGAQGSRRSGGGLAPARRRAVALPASRVLSLGSTLRGAALALLRCRERHD